MADALNVKSFLAEVWDDYKSPSTSAFVTKLPQLKTGIGAIDQLLEADHSGLTRLKKSVKAAVSSGNSYVENELLLAESLEKICTVPPAQQPPDSDDEIASAFLKFAVVSKDLSSLMKNLINSLGSIVLYPLDYFLKNDLKEAAGDLRKSFDKSWKEYDTRFHKIEKDRIRMAEAAGLHKTAVTGPEVAEETDKERKLLQLHATEYLIKVNEIKTKKNVELLNHLVDFYQAQTSFFQDGLKTMGHFNSYVKGLVPRLADLRQEQDNERRELTDLRDSLRSSLACYKETTPSIRPASLSSQPLSNKKEVGTEKTGYLMKKSEGKIKRVWQKRKCEIRNGVMYINHSSESKQPVRLNLLTCSAKLVIDDPSKKCFDLLSSSNNRTYHFQAEDDKDFNEWIAVLNNAKEEQLLKAFSDSSTADSINQNVKELTSKIIADVKLMPGNSQCCDCAAAGPEWLSTNFGVLICLECCGVHREMGVHVSRTQSIVIDHLCTSQLLMARAMGNKSFNDIMEATISPTAKSSQIRPSSPRDERNAFIRAKYESRKFAIRTCSNSNDLVNELIQAVENCEISAVLQVYAEGLDLMVVLPTTEVTGPGGVTHQVDETALHRAIRQDEGTTLHIIDFLVQNATGNRLETKDSHGNTVLHTCATYNRTEAMKLVLKTRPNLAMFRNGSGKSPLDIAKEYGYHLCAELIQHALAGKTSLFENVNFDWTFGDEDFNDFSDDDLDTSVASPDAAAQPRGALALPPSDFRERRRTSDIFEAAAGARDRQRRGGTSVAADVEAPTASNGASGSGGGSSDDSVRRKPSTENGAEGGPTATVTVVKPAATAAAAQATPPAVHMVRAASAAASAAANAAALRERRKTVDSVHLMPPPPTPPALQQQLGSSVQTSVTTQAWNAKTKSLTPREGKMIEAVIGSGNGILASAFHPHHTRASSDSTRNIVMASSSLTAPALSLPPMASEPSPVPTPGNQQPPPLPEKKHKPSAGSMLVLPPPPQFVSLNEKSGKSDSIGTQSSSWAVTAAGVPDDRSQNVSLQSVQRRSSIATTSGAGKPMPPPRPQINASALPIRKRCRAAFDCKADNEDELSFSKDEVIVILKSPADSEWWYGEIDGNPKRRGLFPITFITLLKE